MCVIPNLNACQSVLSEYFCCYRKLIHMHLPSFIECLVSISDDFLSSSRRDGGLNLCIMCPRASLNLTNFDSVMQTGCSRANKISFTIINTSDNIMCGICAQGKSISATIPADNKKENNEFVIKIIADLSKCVTYRTQRRL